jgi:DDE domain
VATIVVEAAPGLQSITVVCVEVLQLCSHAVIGCLDAPFGLFGLRSIQMASISFCWRWDGTCAFPSHTATSRNCSLIGACTPIMSLYGGGCRVTPRKWNAVCARELKPTNDSWRVDETYIRVKGKWVYLY